MAKSGQSSKSPECTRLTINVIRLDIVLDIEKVLIKSTFLGKRHFPPWVGRDYGKGKTGVGWRRAGTGKFCIFGDF